LYSPEIDLTTVVFPPFLLQISGDDTSTEVHQEGGSA
jgi:hypothetical protein